MTPSCVGSNPATPVTICRRGGIGRRAGLKIQCPQGRAGSTPAFGTIADDFPKSECDALRDFLTDAGFFLRGDLLPVHGLTASVEARILDSNNFGTDTERKGSLGALLYRAIAHIWRVSTYTGLLLGGVLPCERYAADTTRQVPS